MKRFGAGILAAAHLLLAGCHAYAPIQPAQLTPHSKVRIDLTNHAIVTVPSDTGRVLVPRVTTLTGSMSETRGDTLVLRPAQLWGRGLPRFTRGSLRESLYVPSPDDRVFVRRFSTTNTVAAIVIPIALFGLMAASAMNDTGF